MVFKSASFQNLMVLERVQELTKLVNIDVTLCLKLGI